MKQRYGCVLVCLVSLLGCLAVTVLIPTQLYAQVSGATLSGTVTDAQGGAVPNATVSAKNTATGVVTNSTTNNDGLYTIPNLNPGDYEVTASASGFSKAISKVTLTVGAKQQMNFTMQVGQITQSVEVTTAAPQVELQSSTLSGVVESTQIVQLPLNGRDWASLATLQAGVLSVRTQEVVTQPGGDLRGLGSQMSVDGNRPAQNAYRLNGVIMNDYSNAGPGNVLGGNMGVDAIQEFSVLTTNYSAEYGFTSGGVINAVLKSGTNQFHGSAYEFLRNSALDAANFFENANDITKGQFRRNQFGASGGAPIIKNKIFIFADYEGLRQSQAFPQISKTLTPNARLGIINDNNGNPLPVLTGACPFANSTNLAPGRSAVCVDNTIAGFVKALDPLPNGGLVGPANNLGFYDFDAVQVVSDNFITARGDYKISDKDSLDITFYRDASTWSKPDSLNNTVGGFSVPHRTIGLEETHIFSPAWVNTVRLGYNQSNLTSPAIAALNPGTTSTAYGIAGGLFAPGTSGLGGATGIPGLTSWGGFAPAGGFMSLSESYQVYDDAVHTFGNHSMKFGFMFINDHDNMRNAVGNGSVSFSTLPNLLENIPHQVRMPTIPPFTPGGDTIHHNRADVLAGYVNDDWKMLRNLTVNLGLRYEMSTIPTETQDRIHYLPNIYFNPTGCIANADGLTTTGCGGFRTTTFNSNPTLTNFEPRIGFAWDPFKTGKTSVRGGFGVFDVLPLPFMTGLDALQTAPNAVEVDLNNPGQGTFPNGFAALATGAAAGGTAADRWEYITPNPGRSYVMQWNFSVQHQLTSNTALTVAYAGSRALHNPFQTDELNTVFPYQISSPGIGTNGSSRGWLFPNPVGSGCLPAPPNCTATDAALGLPASFNASPTGIVPGLLINPYTALIQSTAFISQAWYKSLQIHLERQMSKGFQLGGSFTWQRAEDTSSGSFAGDNFSADATPTIPWWDLNIIKGPSDFNVERNLVINTLWNIPTGSLSGPVGWVAKGWQVGGILSLADGVPIWPLDGLEGDPMGQLNGEPLAIPDLAPGCTPQNAVQSGNVQYLKASCFINAVAPSQAFFNAPQPMGCDKSFIANYATNNPGAPALNPLTCINLLGNLPRNSITGPGLFNVDFSVVKDTHVTKISEAFTVEFRAEFFDVFNHANFLPPVDNLEPLSATGGPVQGFGLIDSTLVNNPNREIQFGLKMIW